MASRYNSLGVHPQRAGAARVAEHISGLLPGPERRKTMAGRNDGWRRHARLRPLVKQAARVPGVAGRARTQVAVAAAEPLERRTLFATITVTSVSGDTVANDGQVTLREAILSANANANIN